MKTFSASYNKIVTVIETNVSLENGELVEKGGRVFCFKTKKEFYSWAERQDSISVKVSQNIKGFVSKMQSLGFDVEIDESYGYEWECKCYCSK